jgi:hypothetical protein
MPTAQELALRRERKRAQRRRRRIVATVVVAALVGIAAHSAQAERPFHGKPNSDSAPSRTPRSEATRLPC